MAKKVWKTVNDLGRMDGQCHNIIHPILWWAYKNREQHCLEYENIIIFWFSFYCVPLQSTCNYVFHWICEDKALCITIINVHGQYRIFRMIGCYFFSLISRPWPILQMRLIYCFRKFRDLKITWYEKWCKITLEIHCKSISANITWNRCSL
jgi:hypothetical protein